MTYLTKVRLVTLFTEGIKFCSPKLAVMVMIAAAFGLFVQTAEASVIGTLDVGSGGGITVSLTSIIWNLDPGANPSGPPWNGEVANTTNITFSGCGGVLGTAGCLDVAPFAPNEAIEINGNVPLTPSTVLPEPGFMVFAGNGLTHVAINYTLTQVLAGSTDTNCAGLAQFNSCSVFLGSPIVLTLQGTGTTATLNLAGTVTDGVGAVSNWTGKFSATFPNETPAQIQAFFCPGGVCSGNQTMTTSYSGSFASTAVSVPEPDSMFLIGAGLIGLAALIPAIRRKIAG